jgi:hypothetical protein
MTANTSLVPDFLMFVFNNSSLGLTGSQLPPLEGILSRAG